MTWGIIAAMNEEIALIRKEMRVVRTADICGASFHMGFVGDTEIVAVCCGIGTVNAAVCACAVIREFGADAVVNIGVAGSACPELGVLDVVLASELVFHDAQTGFLSKYYPYMEAFPTDGRLLAAAREIIEDMPGRSFEYRVGRVATGDWFVSERALKEDIIRRCDPLCVEMEGAAIAQVCHMNRIPCIVIRTLSDNAAEDAAESFEKLLPIAAENSARIALGLISRKLPV